MKRTGGEGLPQMPDPVLPGDPPRSVKKRSSFESTSAKLITRLQHDLLKMQMEVVERMVMTVKEQQYHLTDQRLRHSYSLSGWDVRMPSVALVIASPPDKSPAMSYRSAGAGTLMVGSGIGVGQSVVPSFSGATPTTPDVGERSTEQAVSEDDWENIKQEALKLLQADLLDTPERHLAYIRDRLKVGLDVDL